MNMNKGEKTMLENYEDDYESNENENNIVDEEASDLGFYLSVSWYIIFNNNLSCGAKDLFLKLKSIAFRNNCTWMSHRNLASVCDISMSVLKRRISELKEAGWVDVQARVRNDNSQTSNLIILRRIPKPENYDNITTLLKIKPAPFQSRD